MSTKTKRTSKPFNLVRALQVCRQIIQHPETWDQNHWHCGTTHCFGGWCQIAAGGRFTYDSGAVRADATKWVGKDLPDNIFRWNNTITDILWYLFQAIGQEHRADPMTLRALKLYIEVNRLDNDYDKRFPRAIRKALFELRDTPKIRFSREDS